MAIKKRARKAPITSNTSSSTSIIPSSGGTAANAPANRPSSSGTRSKSRSKSSRETQSLISTYHTLLKRRKQLLAANDAAGVVELDAEMEMISGLDAYQKASQMGQAKERGGDSGRVLVPWLQELGWGPGAPGAGPSGSASLGGPSDDSARAGRAEQAVAGAVDRKGKGRASGRCGTSVLQSSSKADVHPLPKWTGPARMRT